MASLPNWITERITPDAVTTVAARLGEPDATVARGLRTAVTSVLAGLATKTGDADTMRKAYDLAMSRENDQNVSSDLGSTISRALAAGSPTSSLGASLLSTVFGGHSNEVSSIVARAAGLDKPASGTSIMTLAAPIVLGLLGQKIRDRGLGISGFTSMLNEQRDSILEASPLGLRTLVDSTPSAVRVGWPEARRDQSTVPPPRATVAPEQGNRWLWPTIGGLAALALLWALLGRNRAPETVALATDSAAALSARAIDTALAAGRRTVDIAAGTVANIARDLGGFVSRALPGGVTLNVPERGIESQLVAFIDDRSRAVNDTTWFEFDRLNFATGSATILPESQEQLDNISAVLKAYPNVKVKIGGYTDNTGDPAANMRLSQARAESVKDALVAKGIAAPRMDAEGYGDRHPVADNSTDEGRARNRRIALRVTDK